MDKFYIIDLSLIFLLKIMRGLYFDISEAVNYAFPPNLTEDTPCIKEMNMLIQKLNENLTSLKKWEEYMVLFYDESCKNKKDFFINLLNRNYYNGFDFPFPYNSELEGFYDYFRVPEINSEIFKIGVIIFYRIRISSIGENLINNFHMLKSKYRSMHDIHFKEFLELIEFLHDKFLKSKIYPFWDETSFGKFKSLKRLFDAYNKSIYSVYETYYQFVEEYKLFYEEWCSMPNEMKYYLIDGHKHPESDNPEKRMVMLACCSLKDELELLYKELILRDFEICKNIPLDNIDSDDLLELISFVFNYELLLEKTKNLACLFKECDLFDNNLHYLEQKKSDFGINKICKSLDRLYNKSRKYNDYNVKFDLIWKKIVSKIINKPEIMEKFIRKKYIESIITGSKALSYMVNYLAKENNLDETEALKAIQEFKNNNFNLKMFTKSRLTLYSAYSYLVSLESHSKFAVLINMKNNLLKQLKNLRSGSNGEYNEYLYQSLEELTMKLDEMLDSSKIKSPLFNYADDKNDQRFEEEVDLAMD
ncbi:hypothetical protein H311_02252 [Anncaliia algerae PRA109]|nr:hypothetical protein H311_02252 [Anncaliia algerae PRA109]